jgi:2-oxoisovalerate ferredoxin oxidoreductase beta subunit
MVNTLTAPIYIERVALTSTARIMNAKKAVFKAIENLKNRKGFSFVEVLAPCPVNLKMTADQINDFIENQMIPEFPLGCIRDRSAEVENGTVPPPPAHDVETVKKVLFPPAVEGDTAKENTSEIFNRELRIKMAGFGGQGILSLGITLANMARLRNFNVSWMPSYGPEQRGGAASCAVIVSRNRIPSPMISKDCDLLIATTQTALDKYVGELKDDGILIYDNTAVTLPELPAAMTKVGVDAVGIASRDVGSAKFVNSVLIGVLSVVLEQKGLLNAEDQADFEQAFTAAVREKFGKKPGAVESNAQAFAAGRQGLAK